MPHHINRIYTLTIAVTLATQALWAFDYKLKPKRVSPSVWCFFGKLEAPSPSNGGHMSNSCYIKTDKSYVVVDSGPTYQFAQQSYEAMLNIAKLPVKTVINSHYHDDHWQGNSYYKEAFNATLIGTGLQQKSYKAGDETRIQRMTSPAIFKGTTIVKLDTIIKQKTTLSIGHKKIILTPVGTKAHTDEDIFTYFADEKVVFTGDLVMNGRISSNRDGSVLGELEAHKMIHATGWRVLIPGHGLVIDTHALDESSLYFKLLKERVGKAVDDEIGADEVTKAVSLPEFKEKALYKELNKRNIFDAYNELEFSE